MHLEALRQLNPHAGDGHPSDPRLAAGRDEIEAAVERLRAGAIVAIKGLGGFHLACDATQPAAVARLRARKHREYKPFALVARDLTMVRHYCRVGPAEAAALQSPVAPIVILQAEGESLPEAVAPGARTLGFMLPYTPLHHLLMQGTPHAGALPGPLVLTSGNRSDERQCIDEDEVQVRLALIANDVLSHDRAIVNRVDDSVVYLIGHC